MIYKYLHKNYIVVTDYIIIGLIIVNSRSMIMRLIGDDLMIIIMAIIIVVRLCVVRYVFKNKKKFIVKYYNVILLILIFGIYNGSSIYTQLGFILTFLSIVTYNLSIDRNYFGIYYLNILKYLAIFSIISWLYVSLFGVVNTPTVIINGKIYHIAGINFYDNEEIISNTFKIFGLNFVRNNSIFWEGGAYQIFLIMGIIFNLYYDKEITDKTNLIFCFSIITTFSTAGLISLFVVMTYYFIHKNTISKIKKYTIISLFISSIIFLFIFSNILEKVFTKKIEDYYSASVGGSLVSKVNKSSGRRVFDMLTDLKLLSEHPLLGYGNGNLSKWQKVFYDLGYPFYVEGASSSNGFTSFLARNGLLLFIIIMYFFYKYRIIKNFYIYSILILLMVWSQNLFTTPIFLSFGLISNSPIKGNYSI